MPIGIHTDPQDSFIPIIRPLRILRTQKNSSDYGRLDMRVANLLGKQSKIRVASLSCTGYYSVVEEPMSHTTSDHQRRVVKVWQVFSAEMERFFGAIRDLPVTADAAPGDIRSKLERRFTFEERIPLESLITDVCKLLRNGNLQVTHPRCFGLS